MKLLDWAESRADRRDARRLVLIEKGLDWRSLVCRGLDKSDPRFLIALTIIALFAWSFARETDRDTRNLMVGALIAAFAGAWGYYLGSSSTAHNANERADQAMELGKEALRQLPAPDRGVDLELEPGESATVSASPDGEATPSGGPHQDRGA